MTRIHSITGDLEGGAPTQPPFRAPHHTITTAGLVGGARKGWVGEVVLAHRGVLFLDELSEFAQPHAGGAAPAAGGWARRDRAGTALGGIPGTVHADRRDQPMPVRIRGRRNGAAAAKPASRATGAS